MGDSLSPERMQELNNNPLAIRAFIEDELSGFQGRSNFYLWAHETTNSADSARQTDWFLAASQVNEEDALRIIDQRLPNAFDIVEEETRDYIFWADLGLAEQNVQTFLSLYSGETIANVDPSAPPGTCGVQLSGDWLDLQLVSYEQNELSRLTTEYFVDRSSQCPLVMGNLNSLLNYEWVAGFGATVLCQGDEDTYMVVQEFWPNGDFDYTNVADRIRLGEALVKINNGVEWREIP